MMLQNHNIQFTNATRLNDPFDCIANLMDYSKVGDDYKIIQKSFVQDMHLNRCENIRKDTWICSLSKKYDSILMWTYYTSHMGICIGLNMDNVQKCLANLFCMNSIGAIKMDVQYVDTAKKPEFEKVDAFQYQLCTKSKDWEHEQDVRLILNEPTTMIPYYVPDNVEKIIEDNCVITKIEDLRYIPNLTGECYESLYLGLNYSQSEKDNIIAIARKLNPNIKIYQMEIDTQNLCLTPKLFE